LAALLLFGFRDPRVVLIELVVEAYPIVHLDAIQLKIGVTMESNKSVLLALMLSLDRTSPLIVDQPEDNLDSEFIYSTLVPGLRRAKERRQIIIVTHNPNIALLSDAEQIVVLKSTSDKSKHHSSWLYRRCRNPLCRR
jgi:ABC-type cobalamin/Fe3+-siderophores transport system ATPase subunit